MPVDISSPFLDDGLECWDLDGFGKKTSSEFNESRSEKSGLNIRTDLLVVITPLSDEGFED